MYYIAGDPTWVGYSSVYECPYYLDEGQLSPVELYYPATTQQTQATIPPRNAEHFTSSGFQASHAVTDRNSFVKSSNSGDESRSNGIPSEDIVRKQQITLHGTFQEHGVDSNIVESFEIASTQATVERDFSSRTIERKDQEQGFGYLIESLPLDLFSCDYETPEVTSLVSSMDYFYETSTYGSHEEKTESRRCRLTKKQTVLPLSKDGNVSRKP